MSLGSIRFGGARAFEKEGLNIFRQTRVLSWNFKDLVLSRMYWVPSSASTPSFQVLGGSLRSPLP